MGLLDTIKSALGLEKSSEERSSETKVSVEHEPSTGSESAVKGDVDEPVAETDDAATPDTDGTETEAETDESESTEPAERGAGDGTSVEALSGIGPAYGERLADSGVVTVADLAAADAEQLAEETDLPPSRVADWVQRAKEFED